MLTAVVVPVIPAKVVVGWAGKPRLIADVVPITAAAEVVG
jgi:hypothetical protein